ncbi:MAG: 3-deoxy-manno-octulosonate cytidylyltransferase [Longimicrobiales bacterium]
MGIRRRALGVIPARLASERLPRKPLAELAGRPLLEWVWRRASTFSVLDALVVATDSEEVAAACRRFGAMVELTRPEHASGTERVAEVASREPYRDFGIVVNVQGDEPLLEAEPVELALALVREGWDVGTAATPLRNVAELADPAVVKVVLRRDGGALYFSRAAIPHRRAGAAEPIEAGDTRFLRHLGVYVFAREALARWVELPPDELEALERLEQLRALRAGLSIGVAVVERAEGGVDTPADLRRVEERLRAETLTSTRAGT